MASGDHPVELPYRLALAGGWIDQPFVSSLDPAPPGSMVVVGLQPVVHYLDRCGMGTSTRKVARALWGDRLPERDPVALVRELYAAENQGRAEPSGSQDMIGLIYPGVSRLDYDARHEGGYFPVLVESTCDPVIAAWLERVLWLLPVAPRADGYNPLVGRRIDAAWVRRLGASGKACWDAIMARDLPGLGAALNESMTCWEALLPATVVHPTIRTDLRGLLREHQSRYPGAMYSGCGGGYLCVASDTPVPGAMPISVRTA